jgi:3-oxoacyl-[acyl-carrier protein] reductase
MPAPMTTVLPGMTASQWHRVIDVTVHGFFHVTQPLLLPMIRSAWGRIVNISSVPSLMSNRGQVHYAAAKGALNAATRAPALEVATRGITVNAVVPGLIATPMSQTVAGDKLAEGVVPMGRAGRPEDVAGVLAFLASDAAGYITAQLI